MNALDFLKKKPESVWLCQSCAHNSERSLIIAGIEMKCYECGLYAYTRYHAIETKQGLQYVLAPIMYSDSH